MKKMILPVVVLAVFGLLFAGCANVLQLDPDTLEATKLADQAGAKGVPEDSTNNPDNFYCWTLSMEEIADLLDGKIGLFSVDFGAAPKGGVQFRFVSGGDYGIWNSNFMLCDDNGNPTNGTTINGDTIFVDMLKAMTAGEGVEKLSAYLEKAEADIEADKTPQKIGLVVGAWPGLDFGKKSNPTFYYF